MVVHGKKKKFACHICGKEYNTKQYVKQHVKSIHKTDSKGSMSTSVGIDPKTNNTTLLPQINGPIGNGQDTQVRCKFSRSFFQDILISRSNSNGTYTDKSFIRR